MCKLLYFLVNLVVSIQSYTLSTLSTLSTLYYPDNNINLYIEDCPTNIECIPMII